MTVRARDADRDEPEPVSTVLLSAESRALRRRLRPLAWMALEEVALDAVAEEGRFVARTSSAPSSRTAPGRPRLCGESAAGITRARLGGPGTREGTGRPVRLIGVRTGHSRRPHGARTRRG